MIAEKALELIKELNRNPDNLPSFNDDIVRQVIKEMEFLYEENQKDANASATGEISYWPVVRIRHVGLRRNKRLLLAYVYNRMQKIRTMRWEFGSILPPEIRANLNAHEYQWFNTYSKSLANYMRSIGDDIGLNLMQDMKPPKSLYIEVRCLVDYGKIELDDGTVILLKKNTQHLLPRSQCEALIRQGVLQHIVS